MPPGPARGVKRLIAQYASSSLAQKASGSMVLNVVSKLITFVTGIVLARVMTKVGFGYYTFAEAWVNLFCFLAMFGLNVMLTREVARQNTLGQWADMRGLLRWSDGMVGTLSAVIAIGAACVFYAIRGVGQYTEAAVTTLIVAMLVVPLASFIRIRQASVLGFGHIVTAQMPQMLVRPLLFVIMVGAFGFFGTLDGPGAYLLRALASVAALAVGIVLLRRSLPAQVKREAPAYHSRLWFISGLTFMASGTISIVNQQLSVLLVGSYLGGEATAIFGVAKKGAEFIVFIPAAIYLTIGPTVARKFAANELESLQRLLHKTVRWSVIAAVIPGIGLLIFGKLFLWLHGPDYLVPDALGVLTVLTVTSLVFVIFGPTSLILNMCGYERHAAIGVLAATIVNAVSTVILMRFYGVMGAAWAQLISMLVYKIGLTVVIYKLTNLRSFLRFF